jgi:hypothetical protein
MLKPTLWGLKPTLWGSADELRIVVKGRDKLDRYTGEPKEISDCRVFSSAEEIRHFCTQRAANSTWAEFGVQDGFSARFIQRFLPEDGKFYLFDSFEGLPEYWYAKKDIGHRKAARIPTFPDPRIEIVQGWFKDTLPLDDVLGFVHIDSDLYSSAKEVLAGINVIPGTIILFDELWGYAAWKDHEYKALMEWDRPFKFIARDKIWRAAIEVLE